MDITVTDLIVNDLSVIDKSIIDLNLNGRCVTDINVTGPSITDQSVTNQIVTDISVTDQRLTYGPRRKGQFSVLLNCFRQDIYSACITSIQHTALLYLGLYSLRSVYLNCNPVRKLHGGEKEHPNLKLFMNTRVTSILNHDNCDIYIHTENLILDS